MHELEKAVKSSTALARRSDSDSIVRSGKALARRSLRPGGRLRSAELGGRGPLPLLHNDPLLILLRGASNEDLAPLVEILRTRGGATSQLAATAAFRKHFPDHRAYVEEIVADLQKFGGNTLVNQGFRGGRGVPYEEILRDVARKLKIRRLSRPVAQIERDIVARIMSDAYTKMSPEQQRELVSSLRVKNPGGLLLPGGAEALRVAIQHSGFAAYKASVIVANAASQQLLGHGLSLAGNAALTKSVAVFAGPVGLALAAALFCHGAAGPAYRVTVPAVAQIAAIRASQGQLEPGAWERLAHFLRNHWILVLLTLALLLAILLPILRR